MYAFAWPKDPIVYGFIGESGVASNPGGPPVNTSAGWWISSRKLGCGGIEAGEATLACMRKQTWQDVLDNIERRGVTPNLAAGGFGPQLDGKTVFPDFAKRRSDGNFAKLVLSKFLNILGFDTDVCGSLISWVIQITNEDSTKV
jgi:hypothetical protein